MNQLIIDKDELKQEILGIVSKCVRCRFCFSKCPVFEVSDGWLTQGASGITQSLYYGIKLNKLDENLRNILARCTTCRNCEILCEQLMAGVTLVDAILKGRQLLIEDGINPIEQQKKALESLQLRGNPYRKPPGKRTAWAKGQNVKVIEEDEKKIDTLLHVGCTNAYDERLQNVSKDFVAILNNAKVKFGISENEICSGDPARLLGESALFEMLAQKNINNFKLANIKRVITSSPHDFHCFKEEYPKEIGNIEILHHTQLLAQMISKNMINFERSLKKTVTFHDPCYLGKYHYLYEPPRDILSSIPGIKLVEMEKNRENSLCCGGGGGRMWADFNEPRHLAEIRVLEALEAGADLIATACPFCLIHFEDAIKVLNKEHDISVMDIAEIMSHSMGLTNKDN